MQGKKIKGLYIPTSGRGTWRDVEVSGFSGGLIVTTHSEDMLYTGNTYNYNEYTTLQLEGEEKKKSLVFRTSAKHIHLEFFAQALYDCVLKTYAGATISDYGERVPLEKTLNANHNILNLTTVEIYLDAKIEDKGLLATTYRKKMLVPVDVLLAPNFNYILSFNNKHTDKNYVNTVAHWYEKEPRVE